MLAFLNYQNLKSFFPNASFSKGEEYYLQGNVEHLEIALRGTSHQITASVKNNLDKHYNVIININGPAAHLHVRGVCSCPMAINCKHVVAAILQALPRQPPSRETQAKQLLNTEIVKPPPEQTLETWLDALQHAASANERPVPVVDETFSALYLLSHRPHQPSMLQLNPYLARRLKTGEWGDLRAFNPTAISHQKYLYPEDKMLLVKLDIARKFNANTRTSESIPLTGPLMEELLAELFATGRCYWLSAANPPLFLSSSQPTDFIWQVNERGFQTLMPKDTSDDYLYFSIERPWYLNKKTGAFGLLETPLENKIVSLLLASPPIPPEQANKVYNLIKIHQKLEAVSPPLLFKKEKVEKVEPIYCLHLFQGLITLPYSYRHHWQASPTYKPLAALSFRYKGVSVPWEEANNIIQKAEGEQLIKIKRNQKKEQRAIDDLLACGLKLICQHLELVSANKENASYFLLETPDCDPLDFSMNILGLLRQRGWEIKIAHDYPYQVVEDSIDDWYSSIEENTQYDWFGLELGIAIKGEKINLLPVLQQLLQQLKNNTQDPFDPDKPVIAQLPDKRFISLPADRVNNILNIFIELHDKDSLNEKKMLRLSKLHAVRLLELERAVKLRWLGGENLRKLADKLTYFKGIEITQVPSQFKGQLRPYQLEGLSWLQFLREYELSGILADDMGLGKTIQALSHLMIERLSGRMKSPSMVVAPTSLMFNWRLECERFVPELKVLILHGSDRKLLLESIAQYDLILTTYPLIVRDKEFLLKQEFHLLILDEAQFIKNAKSQAAQVAQQLQAKHRLCLTGTPLENHLGELWSLFHFMMPGLLGDEKTFNRLFRAPIEKHGNQERRHHLTQRISPFLLRRTKDKVVAELPKKIEMIQYAELEDNQRDLYETIRITMEKKVRDEIVKMGLGRSHIIILDALLKLRQVCCDPQLLKMQIAQKNISHSAKMNLLMTLLPELIDDGRRILLFSQFTEMLGLIEEVLKKSKITYVKLTGKTKNREAVVEQFQKGDVPLFLISLKAGGTGLNLTAADTVIHYDPWWNPAVENQATDRAHRIGQDKTVFVYKLVAKGTVEEKILQMQQNKQALMDSLFSETTTSKLQLNEKDLKELFEPLEPH